MGVYDYEGAYIIGVKGGMEGVWYIYSKELDELVKLAH